MKDIRNRIAVLLPVYKKDKLDYLQLSLNSLIYQTYEDITIYIGVDGPIEEEMAICLREMSKHDKVIITYFSENRGLAAVLNDLLEKCSKVGYEYIARMDADDISQLDRFDKQIKFLKEHLDVDVVGGQIEEINEFSERNGKKVSYPLDNNGCFKFFRYRDPLAHPAVMFRSSFFKKVKGYRSEYRKNQDTMLWFDGFRNGCVFANLEDTVLLFRVTEDFYKNRRNGWYRARKMLKDRFYINKTLKYDITAYVFSFLMFLMTLTPSCLKKLMYKFR